MNKIETFNQEDQEESTAQLNEKGMNSAIEIARTEGFDMALKDLRESNLLEHVVLEARSRVSEMGTHLDFFGDAEWEALAVILAYDEVTFEHCVRSRILAEKILNMQVDGRSLVDAVTQELGDTNNLLSAAALHDVGKVDIPHFVLTNKTDDAIWNSKLYEMIQNGECEEHEACHAFLRVNNITKDISNAESLGELLKSQKVRAMNYVPIRKVLSSKEVNALDVLGFPYEVTLGDIVSVHEQRSRDVVNDLGVDERIAKLCGSHHNYSGKEMELPVSGTILHASVDTGTLLHCLDVIDAITSKRQYKSHQNIIDAFIALIYSIKSVPLHGDTVYFIVKGLYSEISDEDKGEHGTSRVVDAFLEQPGDYMDIDEEIKATPEVEAA